MISLPSLDETRTYGLLKAYRHTSISLPRHLYICFHAHTYSWKLLSSFRFPFMGKSLTRLKAFQKLFETFPWQLLPHVLITIETIFPLKVKFYLDLNKK